MTAVTRTVADVDQEVRDVMADARRARRNTAGGVLNDVRETMLAETLSRLIDERLAAAEGDARDPAPLDPPVHAP